MEASMKKVLLSLSVFLFFSTSQILFALTEGIESPDLSLLQQHVSYLASDELEGRGLGTEGLWKAAHYIADEFQKNGLLPFGDRETYFQNFFIRASFGKSLIYIPAANVIGLLPANDSSLSDNYIFIGAHYDHLGFGTHGSLSPDEPAIHNGTDDNASGTAGVLEAARIWAKTTVPHGNLVFVTFAGEELGLLGSQYLVEHAPDTLSKTFAMFNMDMIGRMQENNLIIFGTGTAAEWSPMIDEAEKNFDLIIRRKPSGLSPSDNTSFYLNNIPVLFFHTGTHTEYHHPSDDINLINFPGMVKTLSFLNNILMLTTARNEKLTFQETKDPHDPGNGGGDLPYFGSIPDYGFPGPGLRLNGVRANSPAEKAGLQRGDIIIKIDDTDIADIYTFTAVLKQHKAGDTIEVKYVREGKELSTKVTMVLSSFP